MYIYSKVSIHCSFLIALENPLVCHHELLKAMYGRCSHCTIGREYQDH